ncbi:hypothetical protein CO678_15980 [Bradyrhizobium diazoefficiens]|uniref:hypothetical protein n=1 Tax=Bradyrhizobium diazoefficiens TaxID=1355477 RepID=UPI000BE8A88A|nr:hypothetical protein [Bradyrhizobium diazoefficiens]PDT60530.1 hypothetical protein CO678_15980 [Bradyrhizobium diazoefficiens]
MPLTDVQFLANRPPDLFDHAIYLYRKDSWILKHKVKRYVLAVAQDRKWIVAPIEAGLCAAINGSSLFEMIGAEQIVFCDIGEDSARQMQSDDIEGGLCAIAEGRAEKRIFLMAPTDHAVVGVDSWSRAISASHVVFIEEPIVTKANFTGLMKSLAFQSDWSGLPRLARTGVFRDHFLRFIPKSGCTVSELSMEIDRFVLLRRAEAPSQATDRSFASNRRTIDITLRNFLDQRSEAALSEVLVHVDRLLFADMLDRGEVIARLYTTAASIVGGRDRRYKNRDLASWTYIAWGMLVLSCNWSEERHHRRGGLFIAFERICREFMTVDDPQAWLKKTDRWQRIANEIARPGDPEPDKVERSRLDLVNALRERSALFSASHRWLGLNVVC